MAIIRSCLPMMLICSCLMSSVRGHPTPAPTSWVGTGHHHEICTSVNPASSISPSAAGLYDALHVGPSPNVTSTRSTLIRSITRPGVGLICGHSGPTCILTYYQKAPARRVTNNLTMIQLAFSATSFSAITPMDLTSPTIAIGAG